MNYSEVKELLQAGFTADEIRTMMNPQENNPQNQQDNPQPEQKQPEDQQKQPEDQQKQPEDQQKQPEDQPQDDAKFNQLNATMEKLIKVIQTNNLNNNSFDHLKEADIDSKVDKIMAGIIRPERDQKEV